MLISKLDNADADTDASKLLPDADAACRGHQGGFSTATISSQNKWIIKKVRQTLRVRSLLTLFSYCQQKPPGNLPCSCSPFPGSPSSSRRTQFRSNFAQACNEPDVHKHFFGEIIPINWFRWAQNWHEQIHQFLNEKLLHTYMHNISRKLKVFTEHLTISPYSSSFLRWVSNTNFSPSSIVTFQNHLLNSTRWDVNTLIDIAPYLFLCSFSTANVWENFN